MLNRLTQAQNMRSYGKRMLRSSLFRGGVLSLVIQVQNVLVGLVIAIILARLLGPKNFGTYSFALALVSLIQVMPNSGLNNVVLRYSSQYHVARSWKLLRGLWRQVFSASIVYGMLTAGVLTMLILKGWIPVTAVLSPQVLEAASISLFFLPIMTVLDASIRAVNPGVVGQLPHFVVKPWSFLTFILIIYIALPNTMSAEAAMFAQGAAAFITTMAGIRWFMKSRPLGVRNVKPVYETRRWLRSVLPFALLGGLMLINTQADILMLGILGTAHDTGLYKVAAKGANIVALSLIAANLFIEPRIAAMYSLGKLKELQRLLTLSVRSTVAVALVTTLIFWFMGRDLLKLVFGVPYLGAYWPLAILCLGQLINVGTGSVGVVLNMTGNENDAARMAGVAAVSNIALNTILIPNYGGIGAAISTSITMLIWNILMLHKVRLNIKVDPSVFSRLTPS